LAEVYNRVVNALREHTGESNSTRGQDGEYNDYLEKRRPFVEADNLRTSHWFKFNPDFLKEQNYVFFNFIKEKTVLICIKIIFYAFFVNIW